MHGNEIIWKVLLVKVNIPHVGQENMKIILILKNSIKME